MDAESFLWCSTLGTAITAEAGGRVSHAGLPKRMWDSDVAPAQGLRNIQE